MHKPSLTPSIVPSLAVFVKKQLLVGTHRYNLNNKSNLNSRGVLIFKNAAKVFKLFRFISFLWTLSL